MGVNDAVLNNSEIFIGTAKDITDCVVRAADLPALQHHVFAACVNAMYLGIAIGAVCGFAIGFVAYRQFYGSK